MFNPQLAKHKYKEDEKKKPAYVGKFYYIFEKYDGWYGSMLLLPNDTSQSFMLSRAGRAIPSVQWLAELIDDRNQSLGYHGRLIFEILLRDVTLFSDLNGVLNRTAGDCAAKEAYIKVHDFIPYRGASLPFAQRYQLAKRIVEEIGLPQVELAPHYGSTSELANIENRAKAIWDSGGEGIILKRADAPYSEGKRNADLMKIKLEETVDLLVIDVEHGQGKYSSTLGALVCKSKDGTIHSISGMSDDQRRTWWVAPTLIVGQVVEVRCMCKLPDGGLREPRFKAIRYDKKPTEID